MTKIEIPDDLLKELTLIQEQINKAQGGLDYFSDRLQTARKLYWQTIFERFPELKGKQCVGDIAAKTIILMENDEDKDHGNSSVG